MHFSETLKVSASQFPYLWKDDKTAYLSGCLNMVPQVLCKGTMLKKWDNVIIYDNMGENSNQGFNERSPIYNSILPAAHTKHLGVTLIPLLLTYLILIHEENPISFTYNTHIQNLSTSHLLHCCLPCVGHHYSCQGHCTSCLTGLPASTFNYALSTIKQNNLLKQDRTVCHSTENPTMPPPSHLE